MGNTEQPLVTVLLLAYNQQAYINEAVASVLNQTYQPLEIILSDDASTDATAAIIREMADIYSGPHHVSVNINKRNLGIGGHVNKLFGIAKGKLIVMFAGDDVSRPDRVAKLVDAWDDSDRVFTALFSSAESISPDGSALGSAYQWIQKGARDARTLISSIRWGHCVVLGATAAYSPTVLTRGGALNSELVIEDIPLAVRAALLGGIGYVSEPLVRYRREVSVWRPSRSTKESFEQHIQRLYHVNKCLANVSVQIMQDTVTLGDVIAYDMAHTRSMMFQFLEKCRGDGKFPIREYIKAATGSGRSVWLGVMGISFAYPRLHYVLFSTRRLIAKFIGWLDERRI